MASREYTFIVNIEVGKLTRWKVSRKVNELSDRASNGNRQGVEYWMKKPSESGYAQGNVVGVIPKDDKKCGVIEKAESPSLFNDYKYIITISTCGMLSSLVNDETFPDLEMIPVINNFGDLLRFIIVRKK